MSTKSGKSRIQSLLITHLQKFGSIDLLLPDGMRLEIGITQETKNGVTKDQNYCWVVTTRDDRRTILDRYSMSMFFDDPRFVIDSRDQGTVSVI